MRLDCTQSVEGRQVVATHPALQRWDTREYGDVAEAHYDRGDLVVRFEDGDRVRVPVERLSAPHITEPDWAAVSAGEFWVNVPTPTGTVEISWLSIRLMTDADFSAEWDRRCAEIARDVGNRLRELREARGITEDELARRVSIPAETLRSVEAGDGPNSLDLEGRILAAMDCSFADLRETERPNGH